MYLPTATEDTASRARWNGTSFRLPGDLANYRRRSDPDLCRGSWWQASRGREQERAAQGSTDARLPFSSFEDRLVVALMVMLVW